MEQFRGFSLCPLQAVDKLPGLPGARRAWAVVEHTRKPGGLPRPERRGHLRAGTPAPAGGEWGRQVSKRPLRHTPIGCLFYGAIPRLLSLPVAVSMPWFTCRIAGKVADGCKATWTNAQRLPRRGEPPRRSRWGGGESTARRIKRPRRLPHPIPETESESNLVRFLLCIEVPFFSTYQPKMKHRLQGDKKTLASDCRMPGLTSEQSRRKN